MRLKLLICKFRMRYHAWRIICRLRGPLYNWLARLVERFDFPKHDAKATWVGNCTRCRIDGRFSSSWWGDHQKLVQR